jgi:hypothetical protein
MITNVFTVLEFPNPLYVAHLDHSVKPPVNEVFYDTGVVHCFSHSNIYFWGNPGQVNEICVSSGWGYTPKDLVEVNYSFGLYDWNVLQVLLYRATNQFLRASGFRVSREGAYMPEQPRGESLRLVYKDARNLPAGFFIQ